MSIFHHISINFCGHAQIEETQRLLKELGFDPGPIDGILGEKTENSIKAFQFSIGSNETGLIDEKLILQLRTMASKIKQRETAPSQDKGSNVYSADSGQPVRLIQKKSVVAPNAEKDSDQANWLLTLIFSTILAWSIGLGPPILIRLAFVRHPISKHAALILVFFFWVLSLVVIAGLRSSKINTHVGQLFVAFASYAILRKGAAKYEGMQSKRQENKKDRNEEWQEQENKEKERRNQKNRHIKNEEYYRDILSLGNNVTVDEIKRRYRELVSKYHPDKVNHLGEKLKETAEREIKRINEAYEYFKNTYNF